VAVPETLKRGASCIFIKNSYVKYNR